MKPIAHKRLLLAITTALFCGELSYLCSCLFAFALIIASTDHFPGLPVEPSSPIYVSSSGYIGFSDSSILLNGTEIRLELQFRACTSDGLLLYTEDNSRAEYFAVGLFGGQILVEYGNRGTINEVRVLPY